MVAREVRGDELLSFVGIRTGTSTLFRMEAMICVIKTINHWQSASRVWLIDD